MWIDKTNDRLRLCEEYRDVLTGKRKKVSVTMKADTPQERNAARERLDEILASRSTGSVKDMTLHRLIELYTAYQQQTVKASTYERNVSICRQFEMMLGGYVNVNLLTAGAVKERFMMRTKNATTLNEYISRFKALMRWGYRNDFVQDVSWLDKLIRMKEPSKREKVQDKFLEREECAALLDAMHHPMWRDLTEFLILTGCRIGEALALDESDIDLLRKEIHITKTLSRHGEVYDTPKTDASVRDIHMTPPLIALTRRILAQNRENRQILLLDHTPMYYAPDGEYASYDAYRIYLARKSMAVLGRKITPHVLRHTHASILAEQGLSIEEIKIRLGHDNSKVTQQIYVHITERRKQTLNNRLDAVSFF